MNLKNPDNQRGITHFTVIKILSKFSAKEMNEFEKLINSPFFNNHSTILKLFCELKKYYPHFSDSKITKEYLYNIVNKGKKYDDKSFRKYLSRINKLAEEYLNILQMKSEKNKTDMNVLQQLLKRDLNEVFFKKLKEFEKASEKDVQIDSENLFLKQQFFYFKYFYKSTQNNIKSHNEELVKSYDFLTDYYLFNSVSLFNQIESNKYSFRIKEETDYTPVLVDESKIEDYIHEIKKNNPHENKDRIFFLEMILNDMKMNSPEYGLASYNKLKKLVYRNSTKLGDNLLFYYLQRLNVFCILENVKGEKNMDREIFENFKLLLDKNLFNLEGTTNLTLLDFRLIFLTALKIKEFEWAERFLNEKINLVKEEIKNNIMHFGKAFLAFYKKNYSETLNHISKIKSEIFPLPIDIYILKLKIFYLLEHFDSAFSLADSFRHFITGNKLISEFHKVTLKNFLKYYKTILRLRSNHDTSKLKKLLSDLENSLYTKEKKWMIEIVSEMLSVV